MSPLIYINEIHPNPESGNEWIELITDDATEDDINLTNYTIFDSYHQIYKFGNEKFNNKLLTVEVSGLNNDQDSVVLEDETGNILDSFSYTTTQKGFSWSKEIGSNDFILSESSRNQINPSKTPTPTISPVPTTKESSPSPTKELISKTPTSDVTITPSITKTEKPTLSPIIRSAQKYHEYDLSKIQLITKENTSKERLTRLVFIGKNQGQAEIIDAIIGSSLIVLSSFFLIYVRIKNKKN